MWMLGAGSMWASVLVYIVRPGDDTLTDSKEEHNLDRIKTRDSR